MFNLLDKMCIRDRAKAYKYIKRILTKEKITAEELERAVKRYAKEKENTDKQYIKHGRTFFNRAYIELSLIHI